MRPGTVESTFSFLSFLLPTSELHVFFQLLQLITHQEKKIPSGLPCSQVKGLESLFSHVCLRWMISAGPGGCEEGVVLFGEERQRKWPAAAGVGLPVLPVRFTQLCAPRPASSSALLPGLCVLGSRWQAQVGRTPGL